MASRAKQSGINAAMHTAGLFSDMSMDGPEIGTLVVVVDRAKNLPSRRSMGKQDPYCAARLGKEAKKTTTDRRGGQTPKWDQELRFTVRDSPDYLTLKVSVFNDDKKTELIGENFLRLDEVVVPGGGEAEMWHTLTCRGKYAGEIRMELTYYDSRPKVEKPAAEKRRERSRTESPAVVGPRQTPVKRRPLPSDPNSAQSTPELDREQGRPLPQTGPGAYQTPPRHHQYSNEHTPGSNRRTVYNQHQPTPAHDRGPHSQTYQEHIAMHDDPFVAYDLESRYDPSVHSSGPDYDPSIHPQASFDSTYDYPLAAAGRRNSNASQAPYPMHDGPPVVSLDQRDHHRRSVAPLSHSNSEPIVPHVQDSEHRNLLHHTVSESHVYDMHASQAETYRQLPPATESDEYCDEPDHYAREDEIHLPLRSSYRTHPDYQAMQPSVEDDEPQPPPPPMHRNSAPNSATRHRGSVNGYDIDIAPAPLNITPMRRAAPSDHHSSPPPPRSGTSLYHGDSPQLPHHQAYDQYSTYSTPERRGSASAMAVSPYTRDPLDMSSAAYSSPPDAQRRLPNHTTRMSVAQHIPSSPASSVRASPYQTPPRGTHPLATQQSAGYGSSPSEPLQYSPADAAPAPLIKPRAVSPGAEHQIETAQQTTRPAVKVNMVRKSVPARPVSRETTSSIPFGPDSFDAFNPNARKPLASSTGSTYSTPPHSQQGSFSGDLQLDQSIRQSPYNDVDASDGTPIHDLHGNMIDPSDRLPVDSWAPEPERKGFSFKPQITPRERDRLTGARSMGNSPSSSFINGDSPNELNGSFSMSTRSDVSSQVSAGSSLLATVGNSRNKLQKKGRPQSEYVAQPSMLHGPGQSSGAGNYPYVNNAKRSSYDVRAGGAPPIPAKVPLDSPGGAVVDMDRLNQELASIDIGPSSNAVARRPRRFGF